MDTPLSCLDVSSLGHQWQPDVGKLPARPLSSTLALLSVVLGAGAN